MGNMSAIFRMLLGLLSIVIISVVIRTFTLKARSINKAECTPLDTDFIQADAKLVSRFQKALTFQTISTNPGDALVKPELQSALAGLRKHIYKSYPQIHSSSLVKHEVVANYSLLYSISGSDPKLTPYLLMGHLDVVPVPDAEKWEEPPFDGQLRDNFIYGRGTIDDKHIVFGILEALEFLLKRGFQPKRSFYLAFGHDEEVRSPDGAKNLAATLASRGLRFEFILDEGLTVLKGVLAGIDNPIALVGSTEKGSVSVRLSVTSNGGHSSMPEKRSCIGILASAVDRVGTSEKGWLTLQLTATTKGGHSSMPDGESSIGIVANALSRLEANLQPTQFGKGPEQDTLEHIAEYMSLPFRVVMSNLWLFGPLVARFMTTKPSTNALIRTTTAVTMFNAGVKENVIPTLASAVVNHRVHPGQTIQEVIEYDRRIINDERVQIDILSSTPPHPISPSSDDSFGYQNIKTSILQVFQARGVVVAPGLMVGNTDTFHYLNLSDNIYRFSPTFMYPEDLKRFHGLNERISVRNYQEAVNFYYHVIMNSDSSELEAKHQHAEF